MTGIESAANHSKSPDTSGATGAATSYGIADRDVLGDSGKTSPLTDLGSPSPPYLKTETGYHEQLADNPSESKKSSKPEEEDTNNTLFANHDKASTLLDLYATSDLSDLDSEAETEKMPSPNGTPKRSKLSNIAKVKSKATADAVIRKSLDKSSEAEEPQTTSDNDDNTLIKEDVIDELHNDKELDLDVDSNEEGIGRVVEELRKSEETESAAASNSTTASTNVTEQSTNGDDFTSISSNKRKLEENDENVAKRHKSDSDNMEVKEEKKSEQDSHSAVVAATATELEGEDEGDDDEDEDEPEEVLTEEQRHQKQLEAEAELEKQRQRKEAIQFLTEIEIDFAKLRDRLYEDKMARFKSELEMCLDGTHPELQTVYTRIDSHREEKVKLSSLNQKYRLECIDRQIRAQRTAVHQQFIKKKSDFRTSYIRQVMNSWDRINKERRDLDMDMFPEFAYQIPEYVDQVVVQREQVNQEISNLVGLNLYYGFPTAPKLDELNKAVAEDDVRLMKMPLTFGLSPSGDEEV